MLDDHMKQLARDFELTAPFASEVPGVYTIPLEQGVSISIANSPQGGYYISCPCVEIPTTKEEEFFNYMMLANLFGQGTNGSVLGMSNEGQKLVLSHEIDHELNYVDFRNVLEDFINSVDFWREEVLNYR